MGDFKNLKKTSKKFSKFFLKPHPLPEKPRSAPGVVYIRSSRYLKISERAGRGPQEISIVQLEL